MDLTSPPASPTAAEEAAARLLRGVTRNRQAGMIAGEGWYTDREPEGRFNRWPNAGASVEEVTGALDDLGVPFEVAVMVRTLNGGRRQVWYRVFVRPQDVPALTRWVPDVQRLADALNDQG